MKDRQKGLRRSLWVSALAIVLCCAMLVGTTFAWFTDSVSSSGNRIEAGTLKVDLLELVGSEWISLKDKDAANEEYAVFDYDLWEPGYSDAALLKVVNKGNLALQYQLNIVPKDTVTEDALKLAEVIDVYYNLGAATLPSGFADVKDGGAYVKVGTLADMLEDSAADPDGMVHGVLLPAGTADSDAGALPVGEVSAAIVLHMQEGAGNTYQGLNVGNGFDIQLKAIQYTYEKDGFGNDQYDAGAQWPIVSNSEFADAIAEGGNIVLGGNVQLSNDITKDVDINLSGNTIAPTHSFKLKNGSDFAMRGGNWVFENSASFGHLDVRPGSTVDSIISFENVVFTSKKLSKTFGPSTDRVEKVVQFTPDDGGAATFVFRDCTFNNAQVLFSGLSNTTGTFTATFENCVFNNMGTEAGIYVQNYLNGRIVVKNCTFNCTATRAELPAIGVQNSTVTIGFEGNNIVNGIAATEYTHDPSAGEDETYDIKVNGTPSVVVVNQGRSTTVTGLDSVTVNGIASK